MDYSRLSRESLIHELEQLNKSLEKVHLERIGESLGVHNLINEMYLPVFWVAPDYSVIWNNHYCVDRKYSSEQNKCYQIFFGLDDVCAQCNLKKVLLNHETAGFQQDGIEIRQMPIVRGGEAVGIFEMHFDMAENVHQIEMLKRENEQLHLELEQITKHYKEDLDGIERFIRSTRSPLAALSEAFKAGIGDSEEMVRVSEKILETFDRGLTYTKHYKEISQISKSEFNPVELIEDARHSLNNKAVVECDIDASLPKAVIGNAFDFKLFLVYLLDLHAYAASGQPIRLSVSQISQTHLKVYLNIEIESQLKRNVSWVTSIQHADEIDSLQAYVAFLGLRFARQYIRAGKGTLNVGIGLDKALHTHVTLILDRVLSQSMKPHGPMDPIKKRVLIADFEKPEISMDIFERYELYFAQDGNSALEMYERLSPDLVIVNVSIENCDGFELYDHLENQFENRSPIIATSQKLIESEHVFMKDYGFDDYFPKPINTQTLNQIFSRYL